MSKSMFHKFGPAALIAVLAAPLGVNAESTSATGAGALNTSARVDFQITIPKFVSLRVGATGATIDLVSFAPTAAVVGNSTPVAGTGGDLTGGAVTATVLSNGGNVTLGASTPGALNDGGANTINWTQITTASTNANLPAPVLANGASTGVTLTATAGVVSQTATWTYSYANSVVPAAGTYGGVGIRNGRVTYTASVL